MGVKKFFKGLFIDRIGDSVDYKSTDFNDFISCLVDATGIWYDIQADIYGNGDKLDGTPLKSREKEIEIIDAKMRTEEGRSELRLAFKLKIKEILTLNFIEKIKISDLLIIGLDGKAFRAKQKQQCSRRFDSALAAAEDDSIDSSTKFDTGNFTPGSPTMKDITLVINEWIVENRSRLPTLVYLSDCSEEGEAEHKIFNIFKESIKELEQMVKENHEDYPTALKTVQQVFETEKHLIVGKDSDLFFLATLRSRYNFYWMKDTSLVFQRGKRKEDFDVLVNISVIRAWIATKMGALEGEELNPEVAKQCINDFCLFALFCGDDFVPANFCFDLHIGLALEKMMIIYSKTKPKLTTRREQDLRINFKALRDFLEELVSLESDFFETKKKIQELEVDKKKCIQDNVEFNGEKEKKLEKIRHSIHVDSKKFEFIPSVFLNGTYEEYQEKWKKHVVCPNYIKLIQKPKKNAISLTILNSLKTWNSEFDDACHSFMVGLQWNLSYYYGVKNLSDWSYNWSFAPTIEQLYNFLNMDKYKENLEHLDEYREQIPTSSILFSIFNINMSNVLLNTITLTNKTGKVSAKRIKTEIDVKTRLGCSVSFEAYHPTGFNRFLEATYYDKTKSKYGHTILIPFVPLEIQHDLKPITSVEKNNIELSYNDDIKSMTSYGEVDGYYKKNLGETLLVKKVFKAKVAFGENRVRTIEARPEREERRDDRPTNKPYNKQSYVKGDKKQENRNVVNKPGKNRLRVMEDEDDFHSR